MEAVGRLVLANTRVSRAIFVLLMVCVARSGSGIELRRAPYLLHQRPDGVTVRWRTSDLHHTSVLRYGDTPYVLDHAVAATQTRQHFPGVQDWEAVVEGLEPDTQHFYAVEGDQAVLAGADDSHSFWTAPAVGSEQKVRLWLLGDSGSNRPREGDIEAVLQMHGPTGPVQVRNGFRRFNAGRKLDGIVLLGDNAYPWGSDGEYQTAFFGIYADELRRTPLWPVIGNHDMDDAYRHIFSPEPARDGAPGSGSEYYYSFDIANVHVVALDAWKSWWEVTTDPAHIPWRKEVAWLEADLAATAAATDSAPGATWTVVVCHFPLYCDGNYDSDTNEPLKLLREELIPVLDRFGVDLYVAGHDHTYQRSYLIGGHRGTRDTFDPDKHLVSASIGRGDPIMKRAGADSGTVHIVSGTGSGTRPNGAFAHPVMVPITDAPDAPRGVALPGSLLLQIQGSTLEGWQVDDNGNAVDHFRMEKVLE